MLGESKEFFMSHAKMVMKNPGEYVREVFNFEDEESKRELVPASIKRIGIEDMLVLMGILEKRQFAASSEFNGPSHPQHSSLG